MTASATTTGNVRLWMASATTPGSVRVWLRATTQIGPDWQEHEWAFAPVDPLDVEYDGRSLRSLFRLDEHARRENVIGQTARSSMTPLQRTAISAHWSAQLRARVALSAAQDAARRPSVVVDMDDL